MTHAIARPSARNASFVVERTYAFPVEAVFSAWADPVAKAKWFVGPDEWTASDHRLDFRVGGRESVAGGEPGGPVHRYEAVHHDIVLNERIVTTYTMHQDDTLTSVSGSCVEFRAVVGGTLLVVTEQGCFLDGLDTSEDREHGTAELLDNLDAYLATNGGAE